MNILQTLLLATGALASSLVTALYVFQEKLLYHPSIPTREYEQNPGDFGLPYRDVDIVGDDGVRIHAWLITQEQSTHAATFLYFHGNAGNIGHRLHDVMQFYSSGFNILMVSYRGYGSSDGTPSESGFVKDGTAALEYVLDRSDILDVGRIFLFGRSIGGACAIAIAASQQAQTALRGIVVENTFTSIDDMIDRVMPFLAFAKPLNRNKWSSATRIGEISLPILFISGLMDELCPPEHMTILMEKATKASFKDMHTVANGTHNDTWWVGGNSYRRAIRDFVARSESVESTAQNCPS